MSGACCTRSTGWEIWRRRSSEERERVVKELEGASLACLCCFVRGLSDGLGRACVRVQRTQRGSGAGWQGAPPRGLRAGGVASRILPRVSPSAPPVQPCHHSFFSPQPPQVLPGMLRHEAAALPGHPRGGRWAVVCAVWVGSTVAAGARRGRRWEPAALPRVPPHSVLPSPSPPRSYKPQDKYSNAFLGYGPEETHFAMELVSWGMRRAALCTAFRASWCGQRGAGAAAADLHVPSPPPIARRPTTTAWTGGAGAAG